MQTRFWIVVADTKYSPCGIVFFSEKKEDAIAKAEEFAKSIYPDVRSEHDGEQWWMPGQLDAVVAVIPETTAEEIFQQNQEYLELQRRNGVLK